MVIVKGLPAIVVGIQRGIVTPGDGRPPDMTETHAFSGMFFTLPVVVGLSLLLPRRCHRRMRPVLCRGLQERRVTGFRYEFGTLWTP